MKDKLRLAVGPSSSHFNTYPFGFGTYTDADGDSLSHPTKKKRGPGYTRKQPGRKKKK